jgi:hypothetical protein
MTKTLKIAFIFAAATGGASPAMAMGAMEAAFQAAIEGPPAQEVCADGWGEKPIDLAWGRCFQAEQACIDRAKASAAGRIVDAETAAALDKCTHFHPTAQMLEERKALRAERAHPADYARYHSMLHLTQRAGPWACVTQPADEDRPAYQDCGFGYGK